MKKKTTKKIFITFGVIFVSILMLIGAFVWCFIGYANMSQPLDLRDFDKDVWLKHNHDNDPNNPRAEMTYDLTKNHLKIGMDKKEVLSLLGKPDRRNEKNYLSYYLGMQGFLNDPGQLELQFDKNDRLIFFDLVEH